jgi:hypothetical protein
MLVARQRDQTTPAVTGTGEISGTVMSAERDPQPMRRAVVTISGGLPTPRSVITDDAGRFTFTRLPAGTYAVAARKAAYLAAPYGAKRPGRAGMSVVLAEGQRASISIAMYRGGAISGALRDAAGLPVGGVTVRAIDARTLSLPPDPSSVEVATTDDRGIFRLYGLLPGEYVLVALPGTIGQGEITAPTASYLDAALANLTSRRSVTGSAAAPPAAAPQRPVGFAPIFYPGTSNHAEAARVRVESGEERSGVDFELRPVSMASIDGVITGDLGNLSNIQVTLITSGPRVSTVMSSNSLSGRPVDAQGRFQYTNLAPGRYRLVARARRGEADPGTTPVIVNATGTGRGGGSGGDTPRPSVLPAGEYLYGSAEVELRGEDATGVTLALQPGGVISGRIVFSGSSAPPSDLTKIRSTVSLEGATGMVSSGGLMMGTGLITNPSSIVYPDGTFEIRSIGPGRFTMSVGLPTPAESATWKLRSAKSGTRDLLDDLLELGPGIDIRNVVVTFSDARTEISGSLQTGAGVLTTDYYIVALPADRSVWRAGSRRALSVRPATDGRFVFADLPAGEYVIAALTDLDPIDLKDLAFWEQIVPAGVKVAVGEGEKKVQDLRIK